MQAAGALGVVQVVTDTCSVMKSAWRLVEKRYPWVTATRCGPSVLTLLIKSSQILCKVSPFI
eukprot:2093015-Pleurochrysis_carterae.AAC.1